MPPRDAHPKTRGSAYLSTVESCKPDSEEEHFKNKPNPYRGFAIAFQALLITKQSHRQTFIIWSAFCFIFELSGGKKGSWQICILAWARTKAPPNLITASSIRHAGAWFWNPCRARHRVPLKLWLSYAGAIGGRSTLLPGGVVALLGTPKTWSKVFLDI
jgi:hypothetical protein